MYHYYHSTQPGDSQIQPHSIAQDLKESPSLRYRATGRMSGALEGNGLAISTKAYTKALVELGVQ